MMLWPQDAMKATERQVIVTDYDAQDFMGDLVTGGAR